MQRRPRALGTNRDMAHHVRKQSSSEMSDAALLRSAAREARAWQDRLMRARQAES